MAKLSNAAELVRYMAVHLETKYDSRIILPYAEAQQLIALLEKANTLTDFSSYGAHKDIKFVAGLENRVRLETLPPELVRDVKRAQVLGIPYAQYLKSLEDTPNDNAE